jgi:hypothetical protein
MPQIASFTLRFGATRFFGCLLGPQRTHTCIRHPQALDAIPQPAKSIEQLAVRARADKGPVVVLTVNLDELSRGRPQRLGGYPLVIDEGAAAAVGELNAPQNHSAASAAKIHALRISGKQRRMARSQFEDGGDLALGGAMAYKPAIAPRAESERKAIEKDRFAGSSFARQNAKSRAEFEIELVD